MASGFKCKLAAVPLVTLVVFEAGILMLSADFQSCSTRFCLITFATKNCQREANKTYFYDSNKLKIDQKQNNKPLQFSGYGTSGGRQLVLVDFMVVGTHRAPSGILLKEYIPNRYYLYTEVLMVSTQRKVDREIVQQVHIEMA